jgi:hypothetical protein
MAVTKLSISLDADTLQAAREAARRQGMSLSAWLSYAAAKTARLEQARAALDEHVAEFGEPDPETVRQARSELEAAGFYEPETPERARARARALARLDGLSEGIE